MGKQWGTYPIKSFGKDLGSYCDPECSVHLTAYLFKGFHVVSQTLIFLDKFISSTLYSIMYTTGSESRCSVMLASCFLPLHHVYHYPHAFITSNLYYCKCPH
jgi:hypothetical protein